MNVKRMECTDHRKAFVENIDVIDDSGVFEGYAAVFDVEDLNNDAIAPGAFARTLSNKRLDDIKLLYQHNPSDLIGRWEEIREDHHGLYVRGVLFADLIRGHEALRLLRAGILDGLSIGFHVVKGDRDPITGVRTLFELDLWEVSLVTFPMQLGARVLKAGLHQTLTDTIWQAACRLDPEASITAASATHYLHQRRVLNA